MNEDILLKYFRGQHTPEEKKAIVEWLDADPETNQREFDRVRLIFESAVVFGSRLQPAAAPQHRLRWRVGGRWMGRAMQLAAALLVVVGVGYMVRNQTYESISSQLNTIEVPAGQRIKIALADGSQIWLNAGTRMEYPVVFDRHVRRVKLSGEALFEVEHDANRPFIVETFATQIEVLGTQFNVLADPQHNRFTTTLLEGSVKVSDVRGKQSPIYMKPDEVVSLIDGRLCKFQQTDPDAVCWTQGLVNIKKPFPELMLEFEKIYNVKIVVERPTMPRIDYMSGQLRVSDGVDHAMKVLQYASDFTFEHDMKNNTIYIR